MLAIAIATVADHNIIGLEVEMGELFSTFAVSDPHLGHAASVQIVSQVSPPIIATAANLAQARGIKEQQAPPAVKQIGGCGNRGGQQFA